MAMNMENGLVVNIIPSFRLQQLIEYIDDGISVGGLLLNFTLFNFIINKTNSRLKQYRPILLQNCMIDTFFNIVNTVTKTQIDQKNGNFYMMMIGPLIHVPRPWNNILICTWVFALFYCMTSVPVQFVYRYFLIVRHSKPTFYGYIGLLFAAMFAAFAYASWTVYTFWPNSAMWVETAVLLRADKIYHEDIPNFVVATVDDWPLKVLFVYAYVLVGISYIFTIFFNLKVYRHLKSMENQISIQAKETHRQISTILIVQAAVPGVICLFPIALAVTLAFLHTNIPGIGLCIGLMFSVIPLANPLLTLIVVRSYRNAIISVVKRMFSRICIYKPSFISPTPVSLLQISNFHSRNNYTVERKEPIVERHPQA